MVGLYMYICCWATKPSCSTLQMLQVVLPAIAGTLVCSAKVCQVRQLVWEKNQGEKNLGGSIEPLEPPGYGPGRLFSYSTVSTGMLLQCSITQGEVWSSHLLHLCKEVHTTQLMRLSLKLVYHTHVSEIYSTVTFSRGTLATFLHKPLHQWSIHRSLK